MTQRRSALWPWVMRWPTAHRRGTVEAIRDVQSAELGNRRDLFVWLPPGYERSGRYYPVIYMQDGQNLFDPEISYAEPWRLDDAMRRTRRHSRNAIVVGIANTGETRIDEYSPWADGRHGGGKGDIYLDWVVRTVKPLIDERYRTRPDRGHTAIAGSSMGGLISLYAFFRRPTTFGLVAALSPSLWFGDRAIFRTVESAPLVRGCIYLDMGAREGAIALADARRMRDRLVQKGYRPGKDLMWVEDAAGRHSEVDWGRRFSAAAEFLLRG